MSLHERVVTTNTPLILAVAITLLPGIATAQRLPISLSFAVLAVAPWVVVLRFIERVRRPEILLFWALLTAEALLTAAVTTGGLVEHGGLAIICWPLTGLVTRFPTRAVIAATIIVAAMALAGYIVGAPDVLGSAPVAYTGLLGLMIAIAVNVSVLRLSDSDNRAASLIDELTGLGNRVALREKAEALEAAGPRHRGLALVLLDLDHFKRINDQHGHQAGDRVLQGFAQLLTETIRDDDSTFRAGGEEFVVLLSGTGLEQAADLAQRVLHAVRREPIAGHRLTVSAGVAYAPPGAPVTWERLFAAADAALYRAKSEGRDRVRWERRDAASNPVS